MEYTFRYTPEKIVSLISKKSIIYFLSGITAVSCTSVNPVPFEEQVTQQAMRSAQKPSVGKHVNTPDIIHILKDTLRAMPVKAPADTVIEKHTDEHNNVNTGEHTGEHIFQFYEITPPDITFSFPSHSIVMIPVSNVGVDKGVANSFCEYWLYTKDGRLVCYCKDTISGLHPVYGNSFNTNNHLPEFSKKIGYGEYRLVYKNISTAPVKQDLIFGLIINQGKDQIDTKAYSGETKEFWIKIYPSDSAFKLNNNNKEPM